jgi:SHR-binding domain of vacuolar-sorting associated protein 13
VFLGQNGPFHFSAEEWRLPKDLLYGTIPFRKLVTMAYIFNFDDENLGSYLGSQNILGRRVNVQLDESEWSLPFSLDIVGVNQTITIYHNPTLSRRMPEGGTHEISYIINQAEGRLGKYTKIIRFSPRLILVNELPVPLRIVSPSSFFVDSEGSVCVNGDQTRPYHIPSIFGGRSISLEIEGPWDRTVPFAVDQFGSHFINLKKKEDFGNLQHFFTRDEPEYDIEFPMFGVESEGRAPEIGIWFETSWSQKNIVVKRIKAGSWASGVDIQGNLHPIQALQDNRLS